MGAQVSIGGQTALSGGAACNPTSAMAATPLRKVRRFPIREGCTLLAGQSLFKVIEPNPFMGGA